MSSRQRRLRESRVHHRHPAAPCIRPLVDPLAHRRPLIVVLLPAPSRRRGHGGLRWTTISQTGLYRRSLDDRKCYVVRFGPDVEPVGVSNCGRQRRIGRLLFGDDLEVAGTGAGLFGLGRRRLPSGGLRRCGRGGPAGSGRRLDLRCLSGRRRDGGAWEDAAIGAMSSGKSAIRSHARVVPAGRTRSSSRRRPRASPSRMMSVLIPRSSSRRSA